MTKDVLLEHETLEGGARIAIVTLNRPDAMNALSQSLRTALFETMDSIRTDASVRAVVLTGAGDRAFTAGLDLKELGSNLGAMRAATEPEPRSNPVNAVLHCGKPVIGAINGAITGGFELALACDILVGSTRARFADTHALVGVMPGWGLSQKLSRILGPSRAREMSLTGRFIDAQTALDWGLINAVTEPDALLGHALDIARRIAFIEPDFASAYRTLINAGYDRTFEDGLALELETSTAWNGKLTPEGVERRREAVMARGRKQV